MFSRLFARDYHDQFRNLSTHHPLIELRHDFLDVGFDLVVGGDWDRSVGVSVGDKGGRTEHVEAIFLHTEESESILDINIWERNSRREVFRRVDSSLETRIA